MTQLPDSTQMRTIGRIVNPSKVTRTSVADMMQLEAAGRGQRDAKPTPVGVVRGTLTADFPEGGGGGGTGAITEYIDFGEYKFLTAPEFFSGHSHLPLEGTVAGGRNFQQAHDFDPITELFVPCFASHYMFHYDSSGSINGAYIIVYALDAVPAGFKTFIHWMYVGDAIRY